MTEVDSIAWEELLSFQGGPTPRTSLRIALDVEITCVTPEEIRLAGRVENLGDGGLLVVFPRAIPPQTRVKLEGPSWLFIPPVEAEVVWTRAGPEGAGVLHGLSILARQRGRELFLIASMFRMLLG
jgi:hypothetical protein